MLKASLLSGVCFAAPSEGSAGAAKAPEMSKSRAQSIYDAAVKAGEAMSDNTLEDVATYIEDKQAVKRGPIILCNDMMADYGIEAIASWPEPGSKAGETGNEQPDKFTMSQTVDGVTKKKPMSYYSILFDSTKKGREIALGLRAVDMADKGEANGPEGYDVESFKQLKRVFPVDRKAERATLSQARTDARNALIKGVQILKQWARVEQMEKVGVRWSMKDSGEKYPADYENEALRGKPIMVLRNTPKPVVLWNKLEASEATAVSVDTFLSYNVEAALKNGGGIGDLAETASRDGSAGEANAGAAGQVAHITNTAQYEGFVAELAAKMQTDEGRADMLRIAAGKNGQAFRISLCIIAEAIDSITTKARPEYEAFLEAQAVKQVKVA